MRSDVLRKIALELASAPAAMEQNRLNDFVAAHIRLPASTVVAIGDEADEDEDAPKKRPPYAIVGTVAVIDVSGVLIPGHIDYPGYVKGFGAITAGVRAALVDPAVSSIVLRVDSPGGYTTGCPECADAIFEARGKKPIVAFAEGMAASAAYWTASAAEKLYTSKSALVGSIGVWSCHLDWTGLYESYGIKATLVHSGDRKVDTHPLRPMDDAARATLQERCDEIRDMFAGQVATQRGSTIEKMKATQARMWMGAAAVKEGLADGVTSLEALVAGLNASAAAAAIPITTPAASGKDKEAMSTEATKNAPSLSDSDRAELERLRAAETASKIAAEDRAKQERENVFEKHAKRLTPVTMTKMRGELANVDAKSADTILTQIPDQVHPTPTGSSADVASAAGAKLDPEMQLLDRAKALQKEKPNLRLGAAVNEVLSSDPKFAAEVKRWRDDNPGPVVNLDNK